MHRTDGRSDDLCAPTRTTALERSSNMKERAAEVYPIVSVPCGMIHPSVPELILSATASAMVCQYSTFIFSENMENRTSALTLHMSAISRDRSHELPC